MLVTVSSVFPDFISFHFIREKERKWKINEEKKEKVSSNLQVIGVLM